MLDRPPRVLWLTNVASPYRRPVWEALGRRTRLDVALLEDDARLTRDGRRGADWAAAPGRGYRLRHLRTWVLRRGEEAHFTLRPSGLPRLRGVRAVLLGGWDSPAYWQTLLLARLLRVRAVGFYESTAASNRFAGGPIAAARTWFFRHLDAVVVPGAASAALLHQLGVAPERVVVGFNAVDVLAFAARAADARRAAPDDGPGHRFLYVGQLIPRKNVDGLLEAFARIREPDDRLDLIGAGEAESALRSAADRLGIAAQVRFLGTVPNDRLAAAMSVEHTLVLPSHREVWGLVVNEALACGLHAVVAADAGVTASVDGMAGVVVSATDPAALGAAMAASRARWTGPIPEPAILQHTPEAFADVFADALGVTETA